MSVSLLEKCEEYFDTRNLYEVLQVNKKATDKEIKKAYHKLSLLVHPDRVDENQKEVATEKFKILCKVHSILQNSEKRKAYDDCGEVDDEDSDIDNSWMNYWKSVFRKITLDDIKKYEEGYIGSDTEIRDLKRAYINGKGSMDYINSAVPFAKCCHEPRYMEIIKKLIENGEVEEYSVFFNESPKKKNRRKKKEEREMAEADEVSMEELEKQIEENSERRQNNFFDLIANIENKYGKTAKRKSIASGKASPPANKRKSQRRK